MNAISLAPSSFDLQPYSLIVVENKGILKKIMQVANMQPQITEASALLVFTAWDNITEERIDAYIKRISTVRDVSEDSLKPMKESMETLLKNPAEPNLSWRSKQAYTALGIALVAAAIEEGDSTPMEGFDKNLLDGLLHLREKGLRSSVLMALGFRDTEIDYLVKLKKVRGEKDKLFMNVQ
jgi:nitroreductase/dihydropteridine reductase